MVDIRNLSAYIWQTENALRVAIDRMLAGVGITHVQRAAMKFVARSGTSVRWESVARQINAPLENYAQTILLGLDKSDVRCLGTTSPGDPMSVTLTIDCNIQFQHQQQQAGHVTEWHFGDMPTAELAIRYSVSGTTTEPAEIGLD